MDKTLVCRDCGASFVFTQGEQEFFASRGLTNPPSRCPSCRAAKRAQLAGSGTGYSAAPRPMEQRTLYPATCSRCGKQTQVPFQPRGDRPIFCTDCFRTERAAAPAPRSAPQMSGSFAGRVSRPSFAPAPQPEAEVQRERKPRKAQQEDVVRTGRLDPYKRSSRRTDFFNVDDDDEGDIEE